MSKFCQSFTSNGAFSMRVKHSRAEHKTIHKQNELHSIFKSNQNSTSFQQWDLLMKVIQIWCWYFKQRKQSPYIWRHACRKPFASSVNQITSPFAIAGSGNDHLVFYLATEMGEVIRLHQLSMHQRPWISVMHGTRGGGGFQTILLLKVMGGW